MAAKNANAALAGQTELARKVFSVVPANEPWDVQRIHKALMETGKSGAHLQAIHGCLGELSKASLIRETKVSGRDYYQRSAMIVTSVRKPREPKAPAEKKPRVLRSEAAADVKTTPAGLKGLTAAQIAASNNVQELPPSDELASAAEETKPTSIRELAGVTTLGAVFNGLMDELASVQAAPAPLFEMMDPTTLSATEQMLAISAEMTAVQVEFSQRMEALQRRMEEASLQLMHELEENANASKRLREIQDFIGSRV